MSNRLRHVVRLGGAVAAAAAVSFGGAASAVPPVPLKIAPHQYFVGLVNGRTSDAVIAVACPFGALTGHPLPGQTFEVEAPLAIPSTTGYTGSAAHAITASFAPVPSTVPGVVFRTYFTKKAIPTSTVVPCSGAGLVEFTPVPGSPTAQSFGVTVTFGNVTV
ncbi:MAG TPA: hypothetical protein VKG43_14465 [Acidimicrobiales bacterium]|nr:hypothetical protein [Acidimicrobiales bacterium]